MSMRHVCAGLVLVSALVATGCKHCCGRPAVVSASPVAVPCPPPCGTPGLAPPPPGAPIGVQPPPGAYLNGVPPR